MTLSEVKTAYTQTGVSVCFGNTGSSRAAAILMDKLSHHRNIGIRSHRTANVYGFNIVWGRLGICGVSINFLRSCLVISDNHFA